MDFVLAILPWHIVYGLNMSRKDKQIVVIGPLPRRSVRPFPSLPSSLPP
jgi:hypothetical protein